jgi:hypothetical protein
MRIRFGSTYEFKNKIFSNTNETWNFIENKVTFTHFYTVYIAFYTFMYLWPTYYTLEIRVYIPTHPLF